MRGSSCWSNKTIRYRGELPGTSPGDKAIPVAVSRGSWICSAYISAEELAKLQHPNILPLLGFAVQSPRSNLMSRMMFGNDPKYYVYPLMSWSAADQPAVYTSAGGFHFKHQCVSLSACETPVLCVG